MKQNFILSLMLMTFIFVSTVSLERHSRQSFIFRRKVKLGSAPLSLAHLLKKLGAKGSIMRLAKYIHFKCGSKALLRHWIRIVYMNRRVISRSTQHPFTLRRFRSINHNHRKAIIRLFLRSFIRCGRVPGAKRAFKKIFISYAATRQEKKLKLLKLTQYLKKVFFTKSRLKKQSDNQTIYPTFLLKKIIKLRRYMQMCIMVKRICRISSKNCRSYRTSCKKAYRLKRSVKNPVRKIFVDYFSRLWHNYISSPSQSRIKVYIVKRYKRRFKSYLH